MPTFTVKIVAEIEVTDIEAEDEDSAIARAYKKVDERLNDYYLAEVADSLNEVVTEQVD